jgi:hypothetical protein
MKRFLVAAAGLFLMAISSAYSYDDGDFQVWHTETQEKEINNSLKVGLEEEVRFGGSASELYYHHYDLGFVKSINKNLDIGVNYRQVYEKKSGKFKEENRPHINAVLKTSFLGCQIDDRNRFQYRHFDYKADLWQYRNKLTVRLPFKFSRFEFKPYISDEVFIDLDDNGLSRNRFYSGLAFKLFKDLKGEIYYLLQSSKGATHWTDANVLGTKVKLSF